jgi:hypothetical protein
VSKNGLHRHYDKLSAEERFRLDVLAMARGDDQESERLVRSCPRATYTTNDRAFTVRWTSCENIALRISLPLLQELGRLRVVDAMRVLAPYQGTLNENLAFDAYYKGHEAGSYHAWGYAGKTGHPPAWPKGEDPEEIGEPDEDERDPATERDEAELTTIAEVNSRFLPEILDKIERECVGRAYSVWAGFEAFCEECAGVPGEKVAAVVLAPLVGSIGALKRRAEALGVEADADTVEELREGLAEGWRGARERGI